MIVAALDPSSVTVGERSRMHVVLRNTSERMCTSVDCRFRVSRDLSVLRGRSRLVAERIEPGQAAVSEMDVVGRRIGDAQVQITALTYMDGWGRVHDLKEDTTLDVRVRPAAPLPETTFGLISMTKSLPHQRWQEFHGRILHRGGPAIRDATVRVDDCPFDVGEHPAVPRLGPIAVNAAADFRIPVRPTAAGQAVPLMLRVSITDVEGRIQRQRVRALLRVQSVSSTPASSDRANDRLMLLYVSAEPQGAPKLNTGVEEREIAHELVLQSKDNYYFERCPNATADDFSRALHRSRPRLVVMSGHGTEDGSFCLLDKEARPHPVSPQFFADNFSVTRFGAVHCVVFLACHSRAQADAIAQHVPYVVSIRGPVANSAAVAFIKHFAIRYFSDDDEDVEAAVITGNANIRELGLSRPTYFEISRESSS